MANENIYSLFPLDKTKGKNDLVIKKKRVLVGRVQACDIVIPYSDISAIHAVIEVNENGFTVYDMNSHNGTFVNGEKVIAKSFGANDALKFSIHEFVIKEIQSEDILPPPLDIIPINEELSKKSRLPKAPIGEESDIVPRVEYPLAKDPKAEFSEYIFEDIGDLYPIFDYRVNNDAVEIIILFKDKIFSVDYLPFKKNAIYYLVGNVSTNFYDVEYSYLGHKQRIPFIKVVGDEVFVENLVGYKLVSLSEKKGVDKNGSSSELCLMRDNILSFNKKDINIFVRRTDSPPMVKRAPILRRDREFKKYLFLVFLLMGVLLAGMNYLQVDKEIEKEKAPERIATILYKKKVIVAKNKKTPKEITPKKIEKKVARAVKPKKVEPKTVKKVSAKKPVAKKPAPVKKPRPVKKVLAKKPAPVKKPRPVKKVLAKKPAPVKPARVKKTNLPKVAKVRQKPISRRKLPRSKPGKGAQRKSNTIAKSRGAVDTYKSFDFKSTVNTLMAKGGTIKNVNVAENTDVTKGFSGVSGAGSKGGTVKRSKVSGNVGSLAGAAAGKLDGGEGLEGIQNKKISYTAGIPYKTVVLGGMDPDVIRRILKEHIPQFRYCYQKELNRVKTPMNGVLKLNFIIGNSGHVTKAGVSARSSLPSSLKGCVVNVLKGIKFPAPLGGGISEVNQPINFYPNVK